MFSPNTEMHVQRQVLTELGVSQLLPPFQIISHSKNLGESKHIKFDQNYRENYKDFLHQIYII
jgi:hypothetical protein